MAISITQSNIIKNKEKIKEKKKVPFSIKVYSFFGFRQVGGKELMLFTSQMSLMLETGHSLNRALEVMGPQIQNIYFKEVILDVLNQLETGKLFSEALSKYPGVFPSLFISVVKVGEMGGFLKQMMKQLSEYYQQREEYIGAIRKALVYPLVLMVFAFLVVCFIVVYVFPRLAVFLEGKEALLPFTTRFLMVLSRSVRNYWYLELLGFLGIGILVFKLCQKKGVILWLEKQQLRIPILKNLLIQAYTSYFLSNLGFLLTGGIPILEGLTVTKSIVKNAVYERFIQELIESVEKGAGFSAPFQKQSFLPVTVKEMIKTGEETGNLNQVVIRLGEYYSQEFRKGMELFCSILEPLIIVFMGGVVGVIVLSIIIPIFRLSSGMN